MIILRRSEEFPFKNTYCFLSKMAPEPLRIMLRALQPSSELELVEDMEVSQGRQPRCLGADFSLINFHKINAVTANSK